MISETHTPSPCAPVLWLIVPCYNEQDVLPTTAPLFADEIARLIQQGELADKSRVCLVDDGSRDGTWEIIEALSKDDERFLGLRLSRNFGHQNALLAGLSEALHNSDITISIDCDGQDDISAIGRMVAEYTKGFEVVYGVRSQRDTDTAFKRISAEAFYVLMNRMGADVVFNHADYRLIGSKALKHLLDFKETNIFLRGLVPLVGFSSTTVSYERTERLAGESHYPLNKMLRLAFDGITSLSVKPIHLITLLGSLFGLFGLIGVIWVLISFFSGSTVAGWASLMCVVCLIGGIQIFSLGIIGEYVGRIYLESKQRPRYIVSSKTNETTTTSNLWS